MAKDLYQKPIDGSYNPYSDDNAPNVRQHSPRKAIAVILIPISILLVLVLVGTIILAVNLQNYY